MMYIGQMYRESHNFVPHSLFALMSDDVSHTALMGSQYQHLGDV